MRTTFGVALIGLLGAIGGADAHGIAGNRFFPGTMTFDDPAVADEFLVVPASRKHPLDDSSGVNVLDTLASWSFMRLLTPEIAIGVSSGWIHRSGVGFPAQAGFDQTSLEIKKLMYRNDLHEVLVSASLSWAVGNSGGKGGANAPDLIQPGLFIGKGLGDLPDSLAWFRPFAIAAAITTDLPTRGTATNFGFDSAAGAFGPQVGTAVDTLHWGFSIEYSTLYLTDRFKPDVLPKEEPLHQLIPLVEFNFDSPRGKKTSATANPGFSYVQDAWQVSLEASVPINSAAGRSVGVRAQLLLFVDDLIPSLFGKPLLTR